MALPTFEDMSKSEFMPEDPSLPEHKPYNEVVDRFRADIDYWFVRFQNFYDRNNAALQTYRLGHVELVTNVYNRLNRIFGEDIQSIGELGIEIEELIDSRAEELGGINDCLTAVRNDNVAAIERMSAALRQCAVSANQTMEQNLREVFYLEFAAIQDIVSTVPNSVIDVLSRGNVLGDEQEIIQFLRARYEVYDLQWLGGVSTLLGWESNRFFNEGLFLVDETLLCMADVLINHIIASAPLYTRARAC